MKAAVVLAILVLAAGVSQARTQDATATGGGVRSSNTTAPDIQPGEPVYSRDGSDLSDAGEYPRTARQHDIEGEAAVDCQIGNDGYMTRCVVADESVQGYDLGRGLAVTVLKWARADTHETGRAPGDWLRLSTNWKLDTPAHTEAAPALTSR